MDLFYSLILKVQTVFLERWSKIIVLGNVVMPLHAMLNCSVVINNVHILFEWWIIFHLILAQFFIHRLHKYFLPCISSFCLILKGFPLMDKTIILWIVSFFNRYQMSANFLICPLEYFLFIRGLNHYIKQIAMINWWRLLSKLLP